MAHPGLPGMHSAVGSQAEHRQSNRSSQEQFSRLGGSALAQSKGCLHGRGAASGRHTPPELHPCTHPVLQLVGRAEVLLWDSPAGQSLLFTPYHRSSEITLALSTPLASCLANSYLCHPHVAAARHQGAGRQHRWGYPASSGAQRKGWLSQVWKRKGMRQKAILQLRSKKCL